jgi:hypothetical protein
VTMSVKKQFWEAAGVRVNGCSSQEAFGIG